jgi:hypothetical protein
MLHGNPQMNLDNLSHEGEINMESLIAQFKLYLADLFGDIEGDRIHLICLKKIEITIWRDRFDWQQYLKNSLELLDNLKLLKVDLDSYNYLTPGEDFSEKLHKLTGEAFDSAVILARTILEKPQINTDYSEELTLAEAVNNTRNIYREPLAHANIEALDKTIKTMDQDTYSRNIHVFMAHLFIILGICCFAFIVALIVPSTQAFLIATAISSRDILPVAVVSGCLGSVFITGGELLAFTGSLIPLWNPLNTKLTDLKSHITKPNTGMFSFWRRNVAESVAEENLDRRPILAAA